MNKGGYLYSSLMQQLSKQYELSIHETEGSSQAMALSWIEGTALCVVGYGRRAVSDFPIRVIVAEDERSACLRLCETPELGIAEFHEDIFQLRDCGSLISLLLVATPTTIEEFLADQLSHSQLLEFFGYTQAPRNWHRDSRK